MSEDPVSVRRLMERDKARDDGDRLAKSVQNFLRGAGEREGLRQALVQYAEDQNWNGPATNFVIREGDKAGDLDVVSANKNESRGRSGKRRS